MLSPEVAPVPAAPQPPAAAAARTRKLTGAKPRYASFAARLRALLRGNGSGRRHALWGEDGERHFRGPVSWLLGRDLLTYMKSISLYSSNGNELDHRDWMPASVIDLSAELEPRASQSPESEAFWFDYLADSGDGQMAMYSLAYLLLGDLFREGKDLSLGASEGAERLCRGRFLFTGGDTAYHVADRATVAERFAAPFDWALADREREGTLAVDGRPRYLFAIPGNHDYYDALLGFNHLIRANGSEFDTRPLVADFERKQDASYAVMKLPFGWWFWGLDTQNGRIDWRQKRFVLDLCAKTRPKRLIVATPEPTTVFERVNRQATAPFAALGLERPFLDDGHVPEPDSIHLDIAGDVHHYARHDVPDVPNYASVVSGGGGAFLHPTHTRLASRATASDTASPGRSWPRPAQVIYPSAAESCRRTNLRLLCPWRIFRGGYVWLIGAVCAAIIYFGAAVAPHTRGLSTALGEGLSRLGTEAPAWLGAPRRDLSVFRQLAPAVVPPSPFASEEAQVSQPSGTALPAELPAAVVLIAGLGGVFALSRTPRRLARFEVVKLRRYGPPGLCLLASLVVLALLYRFLGGVHEDPKRYGFPNSVMLLCFALPLPAAWFWVSGYVAMLPKQAKYRAVTWVDYWPVWIAMGTGLLSAAFGLTNYGVHAIAQTLADIMFLLTVLFLGIGPAGLGFFQAGAGRRWPARVGFGALGLFLGALQLTIPLLLALDGSLWRTAGVLAFALLATGAAAAWFVTLGRDKHLFALWLLAGALVAWGTIRSPAAYEVSFLRLGIAFVTGGMFTCIWFGWYLASTLAFGGHNNEAGGAAHLDRFRHFIRFKLEPDRLTGYVIGLERPSTDGQQLRPHLVDVFQLTPGRADPRPESPHSTGA